MNEISISISIDIILFGSIDYFVQRLFLMFFSYRILFPRILLSADQIHKAPHVIEMLTRFTDLSNWVAYNILSLGGDNKKSRARMVEKYIRIAEVRYQYRILDVVSLVCMDCLR